jgi:glycerate kinase
VRVVIAPDSFKGSLSALEAARAMEDGVKRVFPQVTVRLFPMADGGEGTLDAVLYAAHGERRSLKVSGAAGAPVDAGYGVIRDGMLSGSRGDIAVIEAAQVVGLTMAGASDVAQRSTQGLGELLRYCLDQGLRRFMIGLGGSSTNDGGTGVLVALGARLLDQAGNVIPPTPAGLADLHRIDFSALDARLAQVDITLMTDVDNPLCGPQGATATFGPQKGVRAEDVPVFDARIAHLAQLCDAWLGRALSHEPGTGAAGGLGYAFMLLGAKRRPGAEVVCELMGLDAVVREADWVLTGEGRSDAQTLHGKLPLAVSQHARRHGVPVTLVSGRIDAAARGALAARFDGCFEAAPEPMPLAQAMAEAAQLLARAAEQAARAFAARQG